MDELISEELNKFLKEFLITVRKKNHNQGHSSLALRAT